MANNITLTGRLTAKPELKTTQTGVSVCSFVLAVKRPHQKDMTDFIPCQAWRKNAEFLTKYADKGNLAGVTGMLTARKWQDKDGNNRIAYEIVCDSVELLESRASTAANNNTVNGANASQNAQTNAVTYNPNDLEELGDDEELPF